MLLFFRIKRLLSLLYLAVSATAFYKAQPVIQFMCEVLDIHNIDEQPRPLTDSHRVKFTKEIKGEDGDVKRVCMWERELNLMNKSALCAWVREKEREHMSQPVTHRHILNATPTLLYYSPGLKVEVTHCGTMRRKYRVCNVTRRPASHQTWVSLGAGEETGDSGRSVWMGWGWGCGSTDHGPQRMRSPIHHQADQIMADSSDNHVVNISHPLVK